MSLRKRLLSFRYAFQGIVELLRTQPNARIHLAATLVVVTAGFYWHINQTEWALIIFAIALVFALEAVNTALEYLTDLVSPGFHPLAGKAKDVAAAAVLIAAIGAVLVGLLVFLPKMSAQFHGECLI
jgi:diacylglycerol kinase